MSTPESAIRLARLVQREPSTILYLRRRRRKPDRFRLPADCFGESTLVGVGCGERIEDAGVLVFGGRCALFGPPERLLSVAGGRAVVRCEQPGEIVGAFHEGRLQLEAAAVMGDGLFNRPAFFKRQ